MTVEFSYYIPTSREESELAKETMLIRLDDGRFAGTIFSFSAAVIDPERSSDSEIIINCSYVVHLLIVDGEQPADDVSNSFLPELDLIMQDVIKTIVSDAGDKNEEE